mmetsp:Transcript_11466/g.23502  ORF Transcript_11466/g.23502 Transcript_11466/m.23502 type:complete len:422 (-) Transcript_11466:494-1759(-)
MEKVRIVETDSVGQALVAAEDLYAEESLGLEVFREEALIIFSLPDHDDGALMKRAGQPPWIADPRSSIQRWVDYWWFKQQSAERQRDILDLYGEMDCTDAQRLRTFLQKNLVAESDLDIEEFTRLAMVLKFNAVETSSDQYGLFKVACRMTHSCRPNCVWFSSPQDVHFKIIRAIEPVKSGQMLTIDYYGKTWSPIHERRVLFLRSKNFVCTCERCSWDQGDDTRRFACEERSCPGVHFVHQRNREDGAEFNPCSQCNRCASEECQRIMLAYESECLKEVNEIEINLESGNSIEDISDRIIKLRAPHPGHGVSIRILDLQYKLHKAQKNWTLAAVAQQDKIKCQEAIMGPKFCDEDTGFAYEKLGDAYFHFDLEKSLEAHTEAVRRLVVTRGRTHFYSRCAIRKQTKVQKELGIVDSGARE